MRVTPWAILLVAVALPPSCQKSPVARPGSWIAHLSGEGGDIPFRLRLDSSGDALRARIDNGEEILEFPVMRSDAESLVVDLVPYPASLRAAVSHDGRRLSGVWSRQFWVGEWVEMAFYADWQSDSKAPRSMREASNSPDLLHRFVESVGHDSIASPRSSVAGRWTLQLDADVERYVAVLRHRSSTLVEGSILTTTGDFRYLDGDYANGQLRLATFDGSHAYLFLAEAQHDGSLAGIFWSYGRWGVDWTAQLDPAASLRDPLTFSTWNSSMALGDVSFPDVNGKLQSLDGPGFADVPRLIMLGGSWCPNCGDAIEHLAELDRRYRDRGLVIATILFELNSDPAANALQARRYRDRYDIRYPLLVGGAQESFAATFPGLAPLYAIPSFLFIDRRGEVRHVYSGYSGPATGSDHAQVRSQFDALITALLNGAEGGRPSGPTPPN